MTFHVIFLLLREPLFVCNSSTSCGLGIDFTLLLKSFEHGREFRRKACHDWRKNYWMVCFLWPMSLAPPCSLIFVIRHVDA
jgi:hypothetical protein